MKEQNFGGRKMRKTSVKVLILLFTVSIMLTLPGFTVSPVSAQLEMKLTASDGAVEDNFGQSVAISGDDGLSSSRNLCELQ